MEYIYAAMILHSAEKDINEENVKSIIEAAGIEADDARIKALIAALEDVDIDEAMETTAMAAAAPAAAGSAGSIKIEAGAAGKVFKVEAGQGIGQGLFMRYYTVDEDIVNTERTGWSGKPNKED